MYENEYSELFREEITSLDKDTHTALLHTPDISEAMTSPTRSIRIIHNIDSPPTSIAQTNADAAHPTPAPEERNVTQDTRPFAGAPRVRRPASHTKQPFLRQTTLVEYFGPPIDRTLKLPGEILLMIFQEYQKTQPPQRELVDVTFEMRRIGASLHTPSSYQPLRLVCRRWSTLVSLLVSYQMYLVSAADTDFLVKFTSKYNLPIAPRPFLTTLTRLDIFLRFPDDKVKLLDANRALWNVSPLIRILPKMLGLRHLAIRDHTNVAYTPGLTLESAMNLLAAIPQWLDKLNLILRFRNKTEIVRYAGSWKPAKPGQQMGLSKDEEQILRAEVIRLFMSRFERICVTSSELSLNYGTRING